MDKMANLGEGRERKPYRRPEMIQVSLRPEEAVLGNCKNNSVSGPVQSSCTSPTSCSASGS